MKRACAVLLLVVATANCAARGPSTFGLARVDPEHVEGSLARTPAVEKPPPTQLAPTVWRQYAQKLPVGSTLRVRTASGERLTGTLLVAGDESLTMSPRARVPEPTREIRFESIRQMDLVTDQGANLAKAAAVGAGIGAGVFFGLLLALAAAVND